MSDLVPDAVNENTAKLVSSADELGKSIASLKAKVQELAETIGDVPDPGSVVEAEVADTVAEVVNTVEAANAGTGEGVVGNGEIYGQMEVGGGTFTTDREVHKSLKHGIVDIFGEGISGASEHTSVEKMALEKIGHAAADIKDKLKGVEESLVNKLTNIQSLKNVMNTTIDKMVDIVKAND